VLVYDHILLFAQLRGRAAMLEINLILTRIKDMQGRLDALRGYL